jgi:hypothetical protein
MVESGTVKAAISGQSLQARKNDALQPINC